MSNDHPFGADTLTIPFTMTGAAPSSPRGPGMSRMRPGGELYRHGVVNTAASAPPKDFKGSAFDGVQGQSPGL